MSDHVTDGCSSSLRSGRLQSFSRCLMSYTRNYCEQTADKWDSSSTERIDMAHNNAFRLGEQKKNPVQTTATSTAAEKTGKNSRPRPN